MGVVYLPIHEWWIFYGKLVGKDTSPMDAMGFAVGFLLSFFFGGKRIGGWDIVSEGVLL